MIPTLDQVNVLHRAGRLDEAERGYRDILAADSVVPGVYHGLGVLLLQTGRAADAIIHLQTAADSNPKDVSIQNALGAAQLQVGDVMSAAQTFRAIVERDPNHAQALANLGVTDLERHDFPAALVHLRRAADLDPNSGDTLYNLSRVLRASGQIDEAEQTAGQALACLNRSGASPLQVADAEHHLAQLDLLSGRLKEGWARFDWRMQTADFRGAEEFQGIPSWTGRPISDGSLLVWTEQGPGDEILYASMIPDIKGMAERMVIACTTRLVPLFRRSFPFADITSHADLTPREVQRHGISAQVAAGSLGQFVRPDMASFSARRSFLISDPARTKSCKQTYRKLSKAAPLIGLSWHSGNPRFGASKSVALPDLAVVLGDIDATFVDLQYGVTAAEREHAAQQGLHLLHDPDIDSITDLDAFAAQVAAMDLVITVSNTTAHVAGALGVPCWTLVSVGAGQFWYWFLDRDDSPWYPSLRLFRQATPGDWSGALGELKTALSRWTP